MAQRERARIAIFSPNFGYMIGRVEVLLHNCFNDAGKGASPMRIDFESSSRLMSIKFQCFCKSHLGSICISCFVPTLGPYCLQDSELETLTVEAESQLGKIGNGCFKECPLVSVWILSQLKLLERLFFPLKN
jgi:hypothetical protein